MKNVKRRLRLIKKTKTIKLAKISLKDFTDKAKK